MINLILEKKCRWSNGEYSGKKWLFWATLEPLSSLSRLSLLGFTLMMKENNIIMPVHRKGNLDDLCCNFLSFNAKSRKIGSLKVLLKRACNICSANQLINQGIEHYGPIMCVTYFNPDQTGLNEAGKGSETPPPLLWIFCFVTFISTFSRPGVIFFSFLYPFCWKNGKKSLAILVVFESRRFRKN